MNTYEITITSLCPPQAYLRLEAHNEQEAAALTERFLKNGSADDFEKALRVLHMAFDDVIACEQYEICNIRPVELRSESEFPVLKREDVEALDAPVDDIELPVEFPDCADDTTGDGHM